VCSTAGEAPPKGRRRPGSRLGAGGLYTALRRCQATLEIIKLIANIDRVDGSGTAVTAVNWVIKIAGWRLALVLFGLTAVAHKY
jgi:hypothetical protein